LRLLAESSGRPLEADGNVGPREMAVTAAQAAGQNPAYGRPIRPLLRAALARVGPCARRARRARSRLPAQVRRVVTNRRPAGPQPTVRDLSAARTRRVATSPRRTGGAVLRRHGPPVRRRRRRTRSRLPAQVRRAVTNCRPAGPQPTVRDLSAARPRRVATSPRRAGGAVRRRHGPPVRRRARSRLPAQVRRVVTNGRLAGAQPTVRDLSAARPRRVATSARRTGGAVLRRHGPPVRRRRRPARSRLPAQVRRAVTSCRPAGPQPTVRDLSAARTRRVATSARRTGGAVPAGTAPPPRASLATTARTRPSAPGSRRCRGTAPRRRAQPGGWSAGRSC